MPKLGEIKEAKQLGRKGSHKFCWHACETCKRPRWVQMVNGHPTGHLCRSCAAKLQPHLCRENHVNWKGGRWKDGSGYINVYLSPDDFFYPMAQKNGYVLEHRLVMAKSLGRCLQPWEIVHHKGIRYTRMENRSDNLEDNLELTCSLGEHSSNHSKGYRDGYKKGLEDGRLRQLQELKEQNDELLKQIKLLRWQIKIGGETCLKELS